jgi:hypothetical protein
MLRFLTLFCLSFLLVTSIALTVEARETLVTQEYAQAKEAEKNSESYEKIIEGKEKLEGLFTIYRDEENGKILLELEPEQLNKNFLCFVTLNSGIGQGFLLRGMPLGDFLFQWRKHQDSIQFVIPNINFRTAAGDPQQRSIDNSFSDSILYSMGIKKIHPERKTILIDLGSLLLDGDLSGLKEFLAYGSLERGSSLGGENAYFSNAKSFPLNLEVESVITVSNGGFSRIPSLPDSRAFDLRIHYSFSEVPINNGFRPRLADERVGYFISAYKDFSNTYSPDGFVRYINRWHLEKQNPNAPLSPPIEPIVFWIENTIPHEDRDAIREGVLMWNKAFEKAGFINAIEVREMPEDATWEPTDIRYNTIRWTTTFGSGLGGFGPSRVNPLTGQILDADIVINGNIVREIQHGRIGTLIQNNQSLSNGFPLGNKGNNLGCGLNRYSHYLEALINGENPEIDNFHSEEKDRESFLGGGHSQGEHACFGWYMNQQVAMGAIASRLLNNVPQNIGARERYIHEFLRYLVAHEVGHTLGLRHNFHGSTMLTPEELHDTTITRTQGLVGSVMDYVPVNLAPPGVEQGDYYPFVVGPYDDWAIEYGYKPSNATTYIGEKQFLEEIARRAKQPELSYGTDDDWLWIFSLDPAVNTFDLSDDMLAYSQGQLENVRAIWKRLEESFPVGDESYSEMRGMFEMVFGYYFDQILNTTLYVGGQSFNRDAYGGFSSVGFDRARLPFEPISVEQQRRALQILDKYVFAEDAFDFSPELLNKLAPSRWDDWGNSPEYPLEYPIRDRISLLQRAALRLVLSNFRLERLEDLEMKAEPENVLQLPEVFETLQSSIWQEVLSPAGGEISISSTRRSLQREHLDILMGMVLRQSRVPEDARSLAWYELVQLRDELGKVIRKRGNDMDDYTRAHLEETRDRIAKALNAQMQSQ